MRTTKVRYVTWLAAVISAFWLFCFIWAIQDYYSKSTNDVSHKTTKVDEDNKQNLSSSFTLVALGDSLTRGTGDKSGKGYVGIVKDELGERFDGEVMVHNLGIKGQVSEQLKKQVKQTEVQRQLGLADTIMITIGGNDLFQQGQALVSFDGIEAIQSKFLANLTDIFTNIRKANPTAPIFFVGLYNPFIELESNEDTSKVLREWNFQSEETSAKYPNIVYVPTFDIFQLSTEEYLYSDKFHPNQEGYRLIAERIAPLIKWEEEKQ